MSIKELRLCLTNCDRATLELYYEFSNVTEYQQDLLEYKTEVLGRVPLPHDIERRIVFLDKRIAQASAALEELRFTIDEHLATRADIEQLLASTIDD